MLGGFTESRTKFKFLSKLNCYFHIFFRFWIFMKNYYGTFRDIVLSAFLGKMITISKTVHKLQNWLENSKMARKFKIG